MQSFFVAVNESIEPESGLVVLEARDRHGRFLGVVSEETKAKALGALKDVVLEMLLDQAEGTKNPLGDLYEYPPQTTESIELLPYELSQIAVRGPNIGSS